MAQRLDAARLAMEARLDALFGTGWVPPESAHESAHESVAAGDLSARKRAGAATSDAEGHSAPRTIRWRIDPGRRAAAAMVGVVVFTAAVVGWRVLADRPRAQALAESSAVRVSVPAGAPSTAATTALPSTAAAAPAVVVDVVGKVRRPGIVRLRGGSRVNDALRAAGGALPGTNLSTVNLARICIDGEQIAIGQPGITAPAGSAPVGGTGSPPTAAGAGNGAKVNLNTASAEQLDGLPGVGPVMAQRILDWRTSHGTFASVDQLKQVSGIGDAKYADISPLVSV